VRELPYTSPEQMARSARIVTGCMLALLGLGAVMAYSSAMVDALREPGPGGVLDPLAGHLLKVTLAMAGFLLALRAGPRRLFAAARPAWVLSVLLLILLLAVGDRRNGAVRWFGVGGASFQPSELARVATMVMIGAWMVAVRERVAEVRYGLLVPFGLALLPTLLVFGEPDYGSSVYLLFMAVLVMWVGGARSKHLLSAFVPTLVAGTTAAWFFFPHFRQRIEGFRNPGTDYQVTQGLTSLGSGGVFGAGLGNGMGKWGLLPEAQNDFLFAVIGEELGLVGTGLVVVLYALFLWHGVRLLLGMRSRFALVVGTGLLMQVAVQAVLNIAVVTALAPNKGLPLPFVSAGGTSLLMLCVSIGLLLGLARAPEEDPQLEARWATSLTHRGEPGA
jgi:cell division protein FtsW